MGIKEGLLLWFINFWIKSLKEGGVANNEIKQNFQLAKELHKPIIRNFKKRTVYSGFIDNIWGVDLDGVQLKANLIKDLECYCVLLIFLVNMLGLFL